MITILGTILIVLVTIGIGVVVDRRWGVLPRKEKLLEGGRRPALPGHAPGEAPATAIAMRPGEIERLRRERCGACRDETDALADDTVVFDGCELLVVHSRCRRCGRTRTTYVRP